ncbi:hypothetical protein HYH02_003010 [Chlamydomonas schloesseri]|uniref:Uncharacterized protein n=1 Tax=Chlamydomonas schloesseri TaxID=2026947 RepID=A0A836BB91_9CHLO|nr:hypothetical protein HYH02_003010 [Chlamydomonas schloesseri]|eukprot:KAG2452780.1 hypothetical protein HYH02_003010 [Chlamydomonas schloesseri]
MKHRIDTEKPETFDLQLSKGKRAMLEKERQYEIDRENAILLQKMVRIKEQDTRAVFRPWTARSTFQWKLGHYYDPTTGTKTLDHINLTSSVSPRSIHYYALSRPGTAPPDVTARMRDMQIQSDNTKLLRTITTMRSVYSVDELERRHAEESVLVNRISNFRGPESARYNPPGRSVSASRRSPYLQPLPGQRAANSAGPARHSPVMSSAPGPLRGGNGSGASQQRYLEEAQGRDIPPPSSRGGSRPGTAIAGPRATNGSGAAGSGGLGATSPRNSDPNAERRASGSAASSRGGSGSGAPAAAAPTGQSFSFGAKQDAKSTPSQPAAQKAADTSGDDYGDDTYEQDEDAYEPDPDQEEEEEEEEEEKPAARAASNAGSTKPDAEEDAAGDSYGDEGFEAEKEDQEEEPAAQDEGEEEQEQEEKAGEDEAEAGQDEEEAGQDEEEAGEDEGEKEADGGFEEDAEEGLKDELEKAEEEEMAAQFNAEMAEDTEGGDDAPLPSLGGFANDWN